MQQKPTLNYEKLFWRAGCLCVAGVDEVGVAPLAGPVVSAAVILKPGTTLRQIPRVRDSKMLSPIIRKRLYDKITKVCVDYAIGIATVEEIDAINIHQASLLSMQRAVSQLNEVNTLLIDGISNVPGLKCLQLAVIDGDAKIATISAASIVAKVTRDLIMTDLHSQYPAYGFDRHKGYGTQFHIARLLEYGPTPIHRRSFLKKIL